MNEKKAHELHPALKPSIRRYFKLYGDPELTDKKLDKLIEFCAYFGTPALELMLLEKFKKPIYLLTKIDTPFEVEFYDKKFPNNQLNELKNSFKSQKYINDNDVLVGAHIIHLASNNFLIRKVNWPIKTVARNRRGRVEFLEETEENFDLQMRHIVNPVNIFFKKHFRENFIGKTLIKIVLGNNLFFYSAFQKFCKLLQCCKNLEEFDNESILQSESSYLALYLLSQSRKGKLDICLDFPKKDEIIAMVRRTKCEFCFNKILTNNRKYKGISRKHALRSFNSCKFNVILEHLQ